MAAQENRHSAYLWSLGIMKTFVIVATLVFTSLTASADERIRFGKVTTKLQCTNVTSTIVDSYGVRDVPHSSYAGDGLLVQLTDAGYVLITQGVSDESWIFKVTSSNQNGIAFSILDSSLNVDSSSQGTLNRTTGDIAFDVGLPLKAKCRPYAPMF